MSSIAITGGATGTGVFSLLAPSTSTNRTINLPDSNGTILTTATAGVPVNGPAFSAYLSANQSITTSTATKILFDTEVFDTNSCFASSRFTPTAAGYYQVNAALIGIATGTSITVCQCTIYKNGSFYIYGTDPRGLTLSSTTSVASSLIYMNGSTDYLEVYAYITATSPIVYSGSASTTFQAAMVRSAV